ncbi:MAG: hypothetical protein ACR2MB_14735 [Acidimicrobiales bacterium]
MNIGQLVRIGGRTRLSPTFSLVGLTGIVIPTASGAPSGCVTVWVNWQDAGYENLDELPPAVNVPQEHLELLTAQDAEDARREAQPAPRLKSVGVGAAPDAPASTREPAAAQPTAETPPEETAPAAAPEPAAEDDEARPKLPLI